MNIAWKGQSVNNVDILACHKCFIGFSVGVLPCHYAIE